MSDAVAPTTPKKTRKPRATPGRKDPSRRRLMREGSWTTLLNRRKDRHYVWVYTGDRESLARYRLLGYEPETWQIGKDGTVTGVQPILGLEPGATHGSEIVVMDHLLMSIPAEDHEEILRYGPDGTTGYALLDKIEERLIDRRGVDPIRGLRRDIIRGADGGGPLPGHMFDIQDGED